MKKSFNFSKEWEKTKKQIETFSKEAVVLAKKGEDELVKFSKKGKLHLDSTAVGLKIEKIYYAIGKEYIKSLKSKRSSSKLNSLVEQYKKLEGDHRSLKTKMRKAPSRKTTKKTVKKTARRK